MTRSILRTPDGTPVVIGDRIGRGGEGTVYTVANADRLALKLYHQLGAVRESHLKALIKATRFGASPAVAWPKQRVLDQSKATVGFLMDAYCDAKPIHELYTPLSRRNCFPAANAAFLKRTALNLSRVVARLHDDGFVIGDLNHSSVLVFPNATVRLVDADSFPVAPNFICRVGTPEYMSAGLQGADLNLVSRSPHHDMFALSVLIYQLLFDGRHPFAGYGGRPKATLADNIIKVKRYQLTDQQKMFLQIRLGATQARLAIDLFQASFSHTRLQIEQAHAWVAALSAS